MIRHARARLSCWSGRRKTGEDAAFRFLARAAAIGILAGAAGACGGPAPADTDAPEASAAAAESAADFDPGARLAGTWRLERIERFDQAGAPLSDLMHPTIGLAPTLGFLMADGERLAFVMQEEAPAAGADGGAAPDDAAGAVERYASRFGPYALDEARGFVAQQLLGSLNPRLTGGRLEPFYEFDGDRLALSPGLQCPDSYVRDRGCAYGTTGIQLRTVWERLPPSAEAGGAARPFLGFWEIDRLERRAADGAEVPAEQFAAGYLVYMPSGYMAVHLMRPDRRPWEGPRPTDLEAHAALRSYASYFGPFRVDADEGVVAHHLAGHLDPGRIGGGALRDFEFRGGQLVLSPPVSTAGGRQVRTRVFWNRLSAPDW